MRNWNAVRNQAGFPMALLLVRVLPFVWRNGVGDAILCFRQSLSPLLLKPLKIKEEKRRFWGVQAAGIKK
jgi:hypothetical protein